MDAGLGQQAKSIQSIHGVQWALQHQLLGQTIHHERTAAAQPGEVNVAEGVLRTPSATFTSPGCVADVRSCCVVFPSSRSLYTSDFSVFRWPVGPVEHPSGHDLLSVGMRWACGHDQCCVNLTSIIWVQTHCTDHIRTVHFVRHSLLSHGCACAVMTHREPFHVRCLHIHQVLDCRVRWD